MAQSPKRITRRSFAWPTTLVSLSESSDSRQANDHRLRFDRRMPTTQSPFLSHDPDVDPAQQAEHLDSGQFAATVDGRAAVETSDPPATLDARLFAAAIGSLELLSVHLGRRLGLYDAIRDAGEVTVHDLAIRADRTPLRPRMARTAGRRRVYHRR